MGGAASVLVLYANAPPVGAPLLGAYSRGEVRVLVDPGPRQRILSHTFKSTDQRWVVPGMYLDVSLDRARDRFDVLWDQLPSISARVAANDPALADPIGAGRKVKAALHQDASALVAAADRLKEELDKAAREPAPAGKRRAVVIVATLRGRVVSDERGHSEVDYHRSSPAVLSVNVPGHSPYAVLLNRFKVPRNTWYLGAGALPALVSAGDPQDVQIDWANQTTPQEMPQFGVKQQVALGINAGKVLKAAWANRRNPEAFGREVALAKGKMLDASDVARQQLAQVADPEARKQLIERYRAAGIELEDGAVGGPGTADGSL